MLIPNIIYFYCLQKYTHKLIGGNRYGICNGCNNQKLRKAQKLTQKEPTENKMFSVGCVFYSKPTFLRKFFIFSASFCEIARLRLSSFTD